MHSIGFIGTGQMAQALVAAIIEASLTDPQNIICSDISPQQTQQIAQKHGVRTTNDNRTVLAQSDTILIAVKPQSFPEMAAQLTTHVRPDHLIISIMAGIRIPQIQQLLPAQVVRVMPNTPCLVGAMAAGFTPAPDVTPEQLNRVKQILNAAGLALQVTEPQLDAVTGLSGSGPAFVARLIQAFINAGIEAGLPPDVARALTLTTFTGTARLLSQWDMPPQELVNMVSSPNGTTVAGRAILEDSDAADVIKRTILRATERSRELGQ